MALASVSGRTLRSWNCTIPGLMVTELSSALRDVRARRVSSIPGPSRPRGYCDARLNELRLKYWTKVPIGDEFAARAISAYLVTDSGITGWFDIDLFLRDLVGHCQDHCSAFLVSSFLCTACVRGHPKPINLTLRLTVTLSRHMQVRIPEPCLSVLPFFAMQICSGKPSAVATLSRLSLQCRFSP